MTYMGVVHSDEPGDVVSDAAETDAPAASLDRAPRGAEQRGVGVRRAAFVSRVTSMVHAALQRIDLEHLDNAFDQFACKTFLYDRMAPKLSAADEARRPSVTGTAGAQERGGGGGGGGSGGLGEEISLTSRLRLVTRHAARLAVEGDVACLYYCTTNGRVFRELDEPGHIDFDLECAPALERVHDSLSFSH